VKIGAKVSFFNARMRERRKEMGLTQKELGELCGVKPSIISNIEVLRPRKPTARTKRILYLIADALECDLDYIFPKDYLDLLESQKMNSMPWSRSYIFIREIHLDSLPPGIEQSGLLLPSAEDIACENIMDETLRENIIEILDDLPVKERRVIELRYGFGNGSPKSLKEVAVMFGVTKERIRQIEVQVLRRFRHPLRREKLQKWLK